MSSLTIESKQNSAALQEHPAGDSPWIARIFSVCMFLALALAFLIDKLNPDHTQHGAPVMVLGIVAILLGSVLVLLDSRSGISLFLLVSCVSPRFGANFRLEDLLVPSIILAWIGRTARGGRFFLRSPITVPFIAVAVTMLLSLLWGVAQGTVPSALEGAFVAVKRTEYGLLFIFAMNSVRTQQECRKLVLIFITGAILASIMSLGTAGNDATVGDTRATGLDEENYNTFAGFLVIACSLAIAATLHYRGRMRLILGTAALLLIATLLKTYSREGYFILAAALAALGIMRYRILLPVMIALAVTAQYLLPESVLDRVSNSVSQVQNYQSATAGQNSFTARVSGWGGRWPMVERHPFFGNGPGSVPLHIDNEYLIRLIEGGAIGLLAFLCLLATFGQQLLTCVRKLRFTECEPIAYGLFAAFVAMVVQGTVAAAWSTIRTMEPFWVLTGALSGLVLHAAVSAPPSPSEPEFSTE